MSFENKIKELNIVLPKAADPVGSYVATKISGKARELILVHASVLVGWKPLTSYAMSVTGL